MYIHDSQSRILAVRSFQEVDFNHNIQRLFSTSRFIDKKNVGSRGHKNEPPTPCSNTAYGQTYLNIFLVSAVCWCIYAGLHQSSSKANSQGQASGRSFNRGASIMAPPLAQLTLTPAQEKEDNESQTQAAKAEIESTGEKIYFNFFFVLFSFITKKFLSINC